MYEFNETGRRWIRVESIMTINDAVHDIAFAPNIGRSYLVLAVATNKDLRIISMKNSEDNSIAKKSGAASSSTNMDNELSSKYQVRLAGHYNDHVSKKNPSCYATHLKKNQMYLFYVFRIRPFGECVGTSLAPYWPHQEMMVKFVYGKPTI